MMRLCLDDAGFRLDGTIANQQEALERLVLLLRRCREHGVQVERPSDIYEIEVAPELQLFQLLFEPERGLDHDIGEATMVALDRCASFTLAPLTPGDPPVAVDGVAEASQAARRGYELRIGGDAVALIQLDAARRGVKTLERLGTDVEVHFIWDEADLVAYFRDVPTIEEFDVDQYMAHAPLAFPAIYFTSGLASQVRRLSRPFGDLRHVITLHLSVLNDSLRQIVDGCRGVPHCIIGELGSLGVSASPESPSTKQNRAAWEKRRVEVDGQSLYCEWHTKIEPHRDRIHFHPGRAGIADGRVVVGIFHEHLPT